MNDVHFFDTNGRKTVVESIINDSMMKQIEEISQKRGISFAEACQILVEHGVSLNDVLSRQVKPAKQYKTH